MGLDIVRPAVDVYTQIDKTNGLPSIANASKAWPAFFVRKLQLESTPQQQGVIDVLAPGIPALQDKNNLLDPFRRVMSWPGNAMDTYPPGVRSVAEKSTVAISMPKPSISLQLRALDDGSNVGSKQIKVDTGIRIPFRLSARWRHRYLRQDVLKRKFPQSRHEKAAVEDDRLGRL